MIDSPEVRFSGRTAGSRRINPQAQGAITTIDVGTLRAFKSHTGVLMTLEMLTGIGLTGLIGFVLGNKLRFS